jgi:hypothetical protein
MEMEMERSGWESRERVYGDEDGQAVFSFPVDNSQERPSAPHYAY